MEPTILPGDRIVVNKLAYGLRVPFTHAWVAQWDDPTPGEIVVLNSPKDGQRLVKRVIAGPGDTVELRNDALIINGSPVGYAPLGAQSLDTVPASAQKGRVFARENLSGHAHAVAGIPSVPAMRNFGPVTVPAGDYFVMGDNRDNSADSRYFGFVERRLIVGRSSAVAISVDPDRYYVPRLGRWFKGLE
jgi:signal peptidase I